MPQERINKSHKINEKKYMIHYLYNAINLYSKICNLEFFKIIL